MESVDGIIFHLIEILRICIGRLKIILKPGITKCHGVKLIVSKDFSKSMKTKLYTCSYESDEIQVIKKLKYNGVGRVLELGSSIGFLSNYLKKQFPHIEHFVGIEANRKIMDLAFRNAEINHNQIEYLNYCVVANNNDSAKIIFNISEDFWSSSVLAVNDSVASLPVQTCKINDLLTKVKPQLLIVDIEGSEYDVLDDTVNLDDVETIVIEVHYTNEADYIKSAELILRLTKMGFKYRFNKSLKNILVLKR